MGCEVLSSLEVTISPAFHCHSKKCTHGREEPLLTCVNMDIVAQTHKRFAERTVLVKRSKYKHITYIIIFFKLLC